MFKSFKTNANIHYQSERGEMNCVDISKDVTTMLQSPILKKKKK